MGEKRIKNRSYEKLKKIFSSKCHQLSDILEGIRCFTQEFTGELVTETMLIEGINDNQDNVAKTADFLHELGIAKAYLAIPTRPPADPTVHPPTESVVNNAYQLLAIRVPQVEFLIGYEGDAFTFTGDIHHDLLSITAVHPMRESAVRALLEKAQAEWEVINQLVNEGKLVETEYQGERFYLRRFSK